MTDRQAMKTHILEAYKARDDSDLDALMSAFHPDAVFKLAGQTTIVEVAGEIRGCSNIRARMAGLIDAFKFSDREIVSFIADGERAAVHSRIKVAVDPTKKTFTTDLLDLFKFEDGQIVELLEFADTALIKDLISGN